jgi:uncharacterized membrane protein
MEMQIQELKFRAKERLKGNWGIAIIAFLITSVLSGVIRFPLVISTKSLSMIRDNDFVTGSISLIIFLLIFCIITLLYTGLTWFCLRLYDNEETTIGDLFTVFKSCWIWRVIGANILIAVFTFLWTLLLIVPGIIKSISYSQTMYILKVNPEIGILEAITESRRMMNGYKLKYVLIHLSFIGWVIMPMIGWVVALIRLIIELQFSYHSSFVIEFSYVTLFIPLLVFVGSSLLLGIISFYLVPYYLTVMGGFYRELSKRTQERIY